MSTPLLSTQESPDQKTYYWKVHGKWDALLKGAEHIGLRMPISVSRRGTSWCGGKQWTVSALGVQCNLSIADTTGT